MCRGRRLRRRGFNGFKRRRKEHSSFVKREHNPRNEQKKNWNWLVIIAAGHKGEKETNAVLRSVSKWKKIGSEN